MQNVGYLKRDSYVETEGKKTTTWSWKESHYFEVEDYAKSDPVAGTSLSSLSKLLKGKE